MRIASFIVLFNLAAFASVKAAVRGVRRRKLQLQLKGFGGEPDPSRFPLQLCQGDCDGDDEVCFVSCFFWCEVHGAGISSSASQFSVMRVWYVSNEIHRHQGDHGPKFRDALEGAILLLRLTFVSWDLWRASWTHPPSCPQVLRYL